MATNVDLDEDVKIVLDPVYGTIHLDRLAVKIIDNPWFQRLRYIKQLAFADYVYPGATHTRFAHSIGVYHLARQMIKEIEAKPLPSGAAKMTLLDKRCIRVAALCHDIGHGPFSHLYEQIGKELNVMDMKHEEVSKVVMEKILRGNPDFKNFLDDKLDDAIDLIKKLIKRPKNPKYTAEENSKKYMFQIVSNKDSGVDVDKWDYFNRDAIACGVPERFQYDRALSVARVVQRKDENVFELAYRDYDAFNVYNMYNTRHTMYRKVYKHKAVVAVDLMMKDVFNLVLNPPRNSGPQGDSSVAGSSVFCDCKCCSDKKCRNCICGSNELFPVRKEEDLSENSKLTAFQNLNDSVLFTIKGKNKSAEKLIDRIHRRDLYEMLIDILIPQDDNPKGKENEVHHKITNLIKSFNYKIPDDAEIKNITFSYGDKGNDPVSKLCFYKKGESSGDKISRKRTTTANTGHVITAVLTKTNFFTWCDSCTILCGGPNDPDTAMRTVSSILPGSFQEVHLRVYYKKDKPVNNEFKKKLEELERSIHEGAERNTVSQADSHVQEPTSMEQDGKLD